MAFSNLNLKRFWEARRKAEEETMECRRNIIKLTAGQVRQAKAWGMGPVEYVKTIRDIAEGTVTRINYPALCAQQQQLLAAVHQQAQSMQGGLGCMGQAGGAGGIYGGGGGAGGTGGMAPYLGPGFSGLIVGHPVAAVFQQQVARPPVKDGGIKLGEITAWRWWQIHPNGLLKSCSMNTLWPRTEPLKCDGAPPNGRDGRGIYCFKTEGNALNENVGGNVFGRVAIWGTIIECTHGYLAEYAKIISIDNITNAALVDEANKWRAYLRKAYGLPEDGKPLYG